MKIVYISIGNSDDKLTQAEWAEFVTHVDIALMDREQLHDPYAPIIRRHGNWRSRPDDPWQNACWCIELDDESTDGEIGHIKADLAQLAEGFRQDSIAWAEATTEFIEPTAREVQP